MNNFSAILGLRVGGNNLPKTGSSAGAVLKRFRVSNNLYVLGTFETGLTIYNQQVRALNLVWAMTESAPLKALRRVAVVGGGFAGLTAAAALLHKGVEHVSLFEKRAALCPLQEGSDTRWVHPRIYDWPNRDSTLPTAALPLLNWNAGRASDVVVEVLHEWERLLRRQEVRSRTNVYVNVKHLRLDRKLSVEWVGEQLSDSKRAIPSGSKESFGSVILAVGFGLELRPPFSYWRNETLGQPELDFGRRTYLVSGHGDGGLVDLFRIRILRFRQDRILVDLFEDNSNLLDALREVKKEYDDKPMLPEVLFDRFESIAAHHSLGFDRLLKILNMRLRSDTAAVLQMSPKVNSFRKVFTSPASFQNRFLLFALYRAGGVIPTSKTDCEKICIEYGIKPTDIIRRHGTDPMEAIRDVMDKSLFGTCRKRISTMRNRRTQPIQVCWTGGYWHQHSSRLRGGTVAEDESKALWRLEHLPPATAVLVTGFISAVSGYLDSIGSAGSDFRVTLHRALYVGSEVALQQASEYSGNTQRTGSAGRTFSFSHATIGYAAVKRQVVISRPRTVRDLEAGYAAKLQRDMERLELTTQSQSMAPTVRSVLAIPILTPDRKRTLAVLYADSTRFNAFSMKCTATICKMCKSFASKIGDINFDRVHNFSIPATASIPRLPKALNLQLKVIRSIKIPRPPVAPAVNYLNLEFTDFVVAGEKLGSCQKYTS